VKSTAYNASVALAVADALLHGTARPSATLARCLRCLGLAAPAPEPVLRWHAELLQRFAARWSPALRFELRDFLAVHPDFSETHHVVRQVYFNAPVMRAPSLGWPLALPDLPTTGDLAYWLNLEPGELLWFADPQHRNSRTREPRLHHYSVRAVPKRHGGLRLLEIPKPRLRGMQRRILHELLEHVPCHEAAQAFRRGHDCRSNAALHVGQDVVLRFDLEDFFLGIGRARVRALFAALGYPPTVAALLAGLCTSSLPRDEFDAACGPVSSAAELAPHWQQRRRFAAPHLPQGAPTSPMLANLIAFRLDLRLTAAAEQFGARYSRYADDLALSGNSDFARCLGRFMTTATQIIGDEGFRLNARKTRVSRAGQRQMVTGLVVNQRLSIARDEIDRLRAVLHLCRMRGPASQNRTGHADFRAHLRGRIARVASVHAGRGARLLQQFDAIDWSKH
jgi:RNA-directed DNA polymerase